VWIISLIGGIAAVAGIDVWLFPRGYGLTD
jgi:hypothetical protein